MGDEAGCNKIAKYGSVYKKMRKDMKKACKAGDEIACKVYKREKARVKAKIKTACESGNEKACEKLSKILARK